MRIFNFFRGESSVIGLRSYGDEVVGIEDFEAFEKEAKAPGDRREFAGDGWREGDAVELICAIGKKLFDFRWTDAARLRVGRVKPEVVPPGFPDAKERGGQTNQSIRKR
jgi:hypothetical protein